MAIHHTVAVESQSVSAGEFPDYPFLRDRLGLLIWLNCADEQTTH